MIMRPMLAANAELSDIKYPVYASPKLDGIRGVVIDGKLRSRSLKPIPNPHVSATFSRTEYNGLDGELILGSPTAKDVYRVTNAACARHEGTPGVRFYVFDNYLAKGTYKERMGSWCFEHWPTKEHQVVMTGAYEVKDEKRLLEVEAKVLEQGYEGLILRAPDGLYKFGRSTVNQGWMLKIKRFRDIEVEIVEVYEEMENRNEAKTNELGRTARSSHKAGMVGKGRAGGFIVTHPDWGQFGVGTGLDDADREWYWKNKKKAVGRLIKIKYFPVGVKDLPRHPTYIGGREEWDL